MGIHGISIHGILVEWQQRGLFCVCHQQAIESAIGGNAYQHSKVNQWTTSVVEQTLSQLTKLGKPFKYIGELYFVFCLSG